MLVPIIGLFVSVGYLFTSMCCHSRSEQFLQMMTTIIYIVADGENLSEHTANFLELIHQRWTDFLSSVHHSLVESVSRLVCTRDYTVHLHTVLRAQCT